MKRTAKSKKSKKYKKQGRKTLFDFAVVSISVPCAGIHESTPDNQNAPRVIRVNPWTKTESCVTLYIMKIYLDHCAYNRPFDDQNNRLVRQPGWLSIGLKPAKSCSFSG
jgi:hypothetical protein